MKKEILRQNKLLYFSAAIVATSTFLTIVVLTPLLGSNYMILTNKGAYIITPITYLISPKIDTILLQILNTIFIATLIILYKEKLHKYQTILLLIYFTSLVILLSYQIIYRINYQTSAIMAISTTAISYFLLLYLAFIKRMPTSKDLLYWTSFLLTIIFFIIEFLTLIYQTLFYLNIDLPILRDFKYYDMLFFYAFYLLNPFFLMVFLFSWVLLPLTNDFREELKDIKIKTSSKWVDLILNKHVEYVGLTIGLLYAVLLGSSLYFPWLNPTGKYVGVDAIIRYHPHLMKMVKGAGLRFALSSDRPLFYAVTYFLAKKFGVVRVVKLMPLACCIFFILATYIFAKVLFKDNKKLVALTTLLTPFSINTTMAIFAGLYTNWTAYSVGFIALALILKSEEKLFLLPLGILLLLANVLIHPYQACVIIGSFAVYTLLLTNDFIKRKRVKLFIICLITTIIVASIAYYSIITFKGIRHAIVRQGIGLIRAFFHKLLSLNYFTKSWWHGLFFNTYNYGIGSFINIPAYLLGTIGVIKTKFKYDKLLIAWLMTVSGLAFVVPYNRYMYVLPFHLYLATGTYYIFQKISKINHKLSLILTLTLILINMNYAMRYVLWVIGILF